MANNQVRVKKGSTVRYNRWGYFFLIPFFVVFIVFNLIPLFTTIYYSFFKYFRLSIGGWVGPKFCGFDNYVSLFKGGDFFSYLKNTMILWIIGFIPQILLSLLLAQWFADTRLKLKGSRFFKTVIYLPNLIMAAAFSMLFYALFSVDGPVYNLLGKIGIIKDGFDIMKTVWGTRIMVAAINFLMWFGNTTILLMAGIMGIDVSLYEAAEVDGANAWMRFTRITLPLLKPIFVYVFITSLIGGIQMFDIPQILTSGDGGVKGTSTTLIMWLNKMLFSKNYGKSGALSVCLLIITGILSGIVYMVMYRKKGKED